MFPRRGRSQLRGGRQGQAALDSWGPRTLADSPKAEERHEGNSRRGDGTIPTIPNALSGFYLKKPRILGHVPRGAPAPSTQDFFGRCGPKLDSLLHKRRGGRLRRRTRWEAAILRAGLRQTVPCRRGAARSSTRPARFPRRGTPPTMAPGACAAGHGGDSTGPPQVVDEDLRHPFGEGFRGIFTAGARGSLRGRGTEAL